MKDHDFDTSSVRIFKARVVRPSLPRGVVAVMPFAAVNAATLDELSSEGTPFSKLTGNALLDVAHDFGVRDPALLADEESLRLLVASLAVASGALDGDRACASAHRSCVAREVQRRRPLRPTAPTPRLPLAPCLTHAPPRAARHTPHAVAASAVTAPSVKWHSLESETRGLLVLTIRSKGLLPQSTAAALNVLAQPSVVRRYKLRGNRWTEPPAPGFSGLGAASNGSVVDEVAGAAGSVEDEDAPLLDEDTLQILQAAKDGFGDDFATRSTGEWLNALAAAFDTPLPERPWYMSGAPRGAASRALGRCGRSRGRRAPGHARPQRATVRPARTCSQRPAPSARCAGAHARRRCAFRRGRHDRAAAVPRLHPEAHAGPAEALRLDGVCPAAHRVRRRRPRRCLCSVRAQVGLTGTAWCLDAGRALRALPLWWRPAGRCPSGGRAITTSVNRRPATVWQRRA